MNQGIKQRIISFIKKIQPLYGLIILLLPIYRHVRKYLRSITRPIFYLFIDFGRFWRKLDWIDSPKYKKLKQLKNIHQSKRCFVVCTGPSLRIEDLEKLKDEICFSMNSIIFLFDKTDWRPLYYSCSIEPKFDEPVGNAIEAGDLTNVFLSGITRKRPFEKKSKAKIFRLAPALNNKSFTFDSSGEVIPPKNYRFSDNIYVGLGGGTSSGVGILQLAAYMGLKEIYLYGADCDYGGEKKHFDSGEYFQDSFYSEKLISRASKLLLFGHQGAKEYADAHGIKIYNATLGGALEIYERVDLDEVLKQPRK